MYTIANRASGPLPFLIPGSIPVRKTITLGLESSAEDYHKALVKADISIGTDGNKIFDLIAVSPEKVELDLVVVSVLDLGFKNSEKKSVICAKGVAFGLGLCPAEATLAFRLAYKEQPYGEYLHMAMDEIVDATGAKYTLEVDRELDLWIDAEDGNPNHFYSSDTLMVFVQPRSK